MRRSVATVLLSLPLVCAACGETTSDSQGPGDAAVAKALTEIDAFVAQKGIDKTRDGWRTRLPAPPRLTFEAGRKYFWNLETNKGPLKIRLREDVAPAHVSATIYLTRLGFYDGLRFHRVIQGFMAQGGCPLGNGSGSPGFRYGGEFSPKVRHDRAGLLSAANAGPGTDGSQFFLTFGATPWLDDKHTIYGEVVDGMPTLEALERAGSADSSGRTSEALLIQRATIGVE